MLSGPRGKTSEQLTGAEMNTMTRTLTVAAALLASSGALAGPDAFKPGPVIADFGPNAVVDGATPIPGKAVFRIAFDVSEAADPGSRNRQIETAARVLNMHANAGLSPRRTRVALVVHGGAAMDLVNDEKYGRENANAPLVAALIDAGVSIQLCGQTAAYRGIAADDLLPGVTLSVSAITAHALLQQRGFTLNPF